VTKLKPEILEPARLEYSEGLIKEIHDRMSGGEMLNHICADIGLPWQTYYGWMARNPSMKESHARARLSWADYWAEKVMTISLDRTGDIFVEEGRAVADHARIQRDRLIADNIKWLVGKYAPRTYGDKLAVESEAPQEIKISWIKSDPKSPAPAPEPPKQITYTPPKLPGDLSERDWGLLLAMLDKVKARTPANAEKPPSEVLEAIGKAIDELYAEPVKKVTLPRRGKKA
jgi:hypothetical protein